jgi:hypothetical protein
MSLVLRGRNVRTVAVLEVRGASALSWFLDANVAPSEKLAEVSL